MNRRNFLEMAALAGFSLFAPRSKAATPSSYDGPFFLTINASGGWDPTTLMDPKGGKKDDKTSVNQFYTPAEILTTSGILHAPARLMYNNDANVAVEAYSAQTFFQRHGSKMLVINGVDTTTNNHETGSRIMWSGGEQDGFPSVAAYAAAHAFAKTPVPMAFLSYGGYDSTGGVVPLTRATQVDSLWRAAYPNRLEPKKEDSAVYSATNIDDAINQAHQARLQRQLASPSLPIMKRALNTLYSVSQGDAGLSKLSSYLPTKSVDYADVDDLKDTPNNKRNVWGSTLDLMRQAQLALAAFQSGSAVSASLNIGGFDTHDNHDNSHTPRLLQLLRGLDYVLSQAKTLGLSDKLYVVVTSDFGRTPYYNAQNGKDHWTLTSMMMSGPGIVGGRTVGATTAEFKPKEYDLATMKESAKGDRLRSNSIHKALRAHAKIDTGTIAEQFPLAGKTVSFLKG